MEGAVRQELYHDALFFYTGAFYVRWGTAPYCFGFYLHLRTHDHAQTHYVAQFSSNVEYQRIDSC